MQNEFVAVDMPYMKFMTDYFSKIAYLDEKQKAALLELLGHKMGKPCGERTVEELIKDVPTAIVFDGICEDIDKCAVKYENMCAAVRENGKKGGRPKKKKPQPETAEDLSEEEKPLILSSSIENCVCSLLIQDYDEGSPIHKLKNKMQAAVSVAYAAAYMSICEDFGYDIIFEIDNKNALDIIAELRDITLKAFDGNAPCMQTVFEQAREYAKTVMEVSKDNLLAACNNYDERSETA